MEEVDDTENGNPRYTVYQITNDDKQIIDPSIAAIFEFQVGGTGAWTDFAASAIREIQYAGGRIVLETARGQTDIVRMKSGNTCTKKQLYGGLSTKISDKSIIKNITPLGAKAVCNSPILDEFSVDIDVLLVKTSAQLVANDITLTDQKGGAAGNSIHYVVVNPAAAHALEVVYTPNLITVTLGYASAITTTNQQLVDAINANPDLIRLKIVAQCDEEDKNVIAAIFSNAAFAGGLNAPTLSKSTQSCIIIYGDTTNNYRWEGLGYIENVDTPLNPDDIIKQSIKFSGNGRLYFRNR